jgi:hypothetical protein
MAKKDVEEMQRSAKALKKRAKAQVKAQKKEKKAAKKKQKAEKKYIKQEDKLRRKGIYPMDTPAEEEGEIIEAEEFVPAEWVRKSTEDIPFVEKKIDLMAQRREESSLHRLFEERYGETLATPETYNEYELSDVEKRRLEAIRAISEEAEAPLAPVAAPAEDVTEEVKEEVKAGEAQALSFWNLKQPLWLYKKFGKDKNIIVKIFVGLISLVGSVIRYPILIIAFIPRLIMKKLKARKADKAAAEA